MSADASPPVIVYHHRTQGVDAQGIHVVEMCRAFEALGFRVVKVAIHSEERPGSVSRPGLLGWTVAKLPRWAYELLEIAYNACGVMRLWRAVRLHRPVFIYERYSLFNICGVVVSRLTGTQLALEINSPLAWERKQFGGLALARLAQATETWITRQADLNIAVTGVLKEILVRQGARPDTVSVMPNGVATAAFERIAPPAGRQGPPVLGFTGWFREWHGLAEMIAALDDHGLFASGIRLILAGDGPARPQLEALIDSRGLQDAVTITGPLARQALLLQLADMDIALQPAATAYASPMKLMEYLAAGKAVVAPDQANIREILTHGENGLLFPPGDWAALARRVRELADAPDTISRLGQNARRTIADKNLTWIGNASRVTALMRTTTQEPSPTPP